MAIRARPSSSGARRSGGLAGGVRKAVRCAWAGLPLLIGLAATGTALAQKPMLLQPGPSPLVCRSHSITRFAGAGSGTLVGALEFRGGIEIRCEGGLFGGISGLSLAEDGAGFVMVSDAGNWITGRFTQSGGRLSGIKDVAAAPILGRSGRPLASSRRGDTESLAMAGGRAYVGIERANEIASFDFAASGVMARARSVAVPPAAKRLPFNQGFEAIGVAPATSPVAGAILAISERSSESEPVTKGFLIGGPAPGAIAIRRSGGFDVTDLAFLPGGDLLVLERRYEGLWLIAMRIRRIGAQSLWPGAVLDGPVLLEASGAGDIDNMEALAVSTGVDGETVVTIASDDNFSSLQRNLVLRFALAEPD
jgi:hypothetical protein